MGKVMTTKIGDRIIEIREGLDPFYPSVDIYWNKGGELILLATLEEDMKNKDFALYTYTDLSNDDFTTKEVIK